MDYLKPFEIAEPDRTSTSNVGINEASFGVAANSRALALIEYVIVFPIVAIFVCGFAAVVASLIAKNLVFSKEIGVVAAIIAALLAFAILLRFAIRDYHRRAGSTVIVGHESITISHIGKTDQRNYDAVEAVRIVPHAGDDQYVLHLSDGTSCRIPTGVAAVKIARPALERNLGPRLAEKYLRKIANGSAVQVRDSALRAWMQIASGLLSFVMAAVFMISIKFIGHGIDLWGEGYRRVLRGRRGRRGGFDVLESGVRPAGSLLRADTCPWSSLKNARVDDSGVILEFEHGRFSASIYAEHFFPFAYWVDVAICKPWESYHEGVEKLSEGFMSSGRRQMPVQNRDWP
jgi:hypothetical protein